MGQEFFGAIELGGTKTIMLVGDINHNILSEKRIPTESPDTTLQEIIHFFSEFQIREKVHLKAIGIGSFGPLGLDPKSEAFGYITTTPKPGWQFINVPGILQEALGVSTYVDTDVNAAALGEFLSINNTTITNLAYLTIGTGIGAGLIINGALIHGAMHPEFGHILIPHNRDIDPYKGICPFHGNCFEGLASGPAIAQRWSANPASLPDNHPAWELEAEYISQAMATLICTISPQRIILGGGVMQQAHLFPRIHVRTKELLNDYIQNRYVKDLSCLIVPPTLGKRSGIIGALQLATRAQKKSTSIHRPGRNL